VIVAYGDMRFTDLHETDATNPQARQALVAKVAAERPAAILVSGDVPYHGIAADYDEFTRETRIWRDQHLPVYPALGNHEVAACFVPQCLERWWTAFPEIRNRRWYSVAIGPRVLAVALDSLSSLLPGSEQRQWFEHEMTTLDPEVRVVTLVIHHPPLTTVQTRKLVDHNMRPNEQSIADYLSAIAPASKARFVVSGGHIHNYERLERAGVVYLVSGGGGAHAYEIDRLPGDLYQGTGFPNFHYVRFEITRTKLVGEMIRLEDSEASTPSHWAVRDRFELDLMP